MLDYVDAAASARVSRWDTPTGERPSGEGPERRELRMGCYDTRAHAAQRASGRQHGADTRAGSGQYAG